MLDLTDRETVQQIQENVFMQYFLGYSSFTNEAPFSPSLFVAIRERLSLDIINSINDIVIAHHFETSQQQPSENTKDEPPVIPNSSAETEEKQHEPQSSAETVQSNKGKLLIDATVAPQNITYPTDLKLLNASREKSEELIDKLYSKSLHGEIKVRTYRNLARKDFLTTAKRKAKSSKVIYKANGSQLRYLRRNLQHINQLLEAYQLNKIDIPFDHRDEQYLQIIGTVYDQQYTMHTTKTKSIENRIVNIHQPYVRPIVRGKEGKKVEFGSKLQVSLVNGFAIIDNLSWNNFNEGQFLSTSVEGYKKRFGYYPATVLADKIYCTRVNRQKLKELKIELRAKPLGRPSKEALSNQVSPGERNPIEGKFGQAKVGYGLDCIMAKLKSTSESWIASITLVLNLVNLMRLAPSFLYRLLLLLLCPGDFAKKRGRLSF
jgi:hypothetical protein